MPAPTTGTGPRTTAAPGDPRPPARRSGPRQAPAGRGAPRWYRVASFVALYYLSCWSVIGALWPAAAGGVWLVAAAALLTTVPIVSFIVHRGWRRYPSPAFRLLVVRPVLYVQLLLPLVAGAGLLGLLAGAPFHAGLAAGRFSAAAVFVAMALLLMAGYVGSSQLVVQEVDATIADLPQAWDGLRIAQISDLHVGPHTSRRFLARVVATIEGLAPDLVAITGDMVDDRAEDVEHLAAGFAELEAPLGVYLIAGNHDVYAGWADVAERLRVALPKATLLVNDSQILTRNGSRLAIVGTGDPAGRHGGRRRTADGAAPDGAAPDIDRSLRQVPPATTVIALAHNPALWPELAARGVALTLSGHTHGGQFALPMLGWSLAGMFLPHAMGGYSTLAGGDPETASGNDGKEALLYVSPGTGYWGLPFRIGANPEVTLITVRRGALSTIKSSRRTTGANGLAAQGRSGQAES